MALHRGIQSAIFYYVSCAPCAEARVRKRRKQEAEQDRAEREALETHMPGLYRQPDPSSTNPYWQAEIDAGPIPSRTRKRMLESSKAAHSTRSNIASSVSVDGAALDMERSDSAQSGLGHVQRQDEVLWGAKTYHTELSRMRRSFSNGLPKQPPRARLSEESKPQSYQHMHNAAINDLHPPTTRKVHSKDEVLWMMQPPPLPEVMNNTGTKVAGRPPASNERRQYDDEAIVDDDSEPDDGYDDRQTTLDEQPTITVRRSQTLPIRRPPDSSSTRVRSSVLRKPPPTLQPRSVDQRTRQALSRPSLSTVTSESLVPVYKKTSENNEPHRTKGSNPVNDAAFTTPNVKASEYKWMETRVVVPRRDSMDDPPENFDAWHSPGFELPQWIHEHTKREVRQRWSFDM